MKNLCLLLLILGVVTICAAQDGNFHLDKEYTISKNGTIDLGSSDAKVFITGSARSTAHIKIDRKITVKGWGWGGEDFRVEVEADKGNLKIKERQSGGNVSVGYYNEQYRIELEVPEGVSLEVRGDDGDYFIKNINGSISMNMDDADAELTDCKGNQFVFRIDDGDIHMDKGRGSIEIHGDDTDVEIYNAKFTSIHADLDDGDLIIETSLSDAGDYDLRSQDGLISLTVTGGGGEFDIRHDDGHIMTSSDFETTLRSEDHTKVSLPKGTARVSVRADDAQIKLNTRY
jgi:hypothetical protein